MSAKIYRTPEHIKLPKFDLMTYNREQHIKDEDNFIAELKQHIKNYGYTGKNSGEIIKFQVADGYALYMVLKMRPLSLIHLPLGDGYQIQYAQNLTAKDVQQKIDQEKALNIIFSKKNNVSNNI